MGRSNRPSSNLSRFFYCKKSEIPYYIEEGRINAWDIVITSDISDHRMIIITDDLRQVDVSESNNENRILVFDSMEEADLALINSGDISVGDIVCVYQFDRFVPYIVNENILGEYYLEPFVTADYEVLSNKPTIEGTEVSGHKHFNDYGLNGLTNLELEALLSS